MSTAPPADEVMCITVATGVMGIFGFLCPGVLDVADKDNSRVRAQQAKASGAGLLLGALGSWGTRSPWPFLTAVVVIGLLTWEFQSNQNRGPA